jgi:hypothetical protein
MRLALVFVGVFAFGLPAIVRQAPPLFNPVGKWAVSTTDRNGQPTTVNVAIAGRLGAYTGQAVTADGQTLPLRDLATTTNGMIALFDQQQGLIMVRMVRDASGKFSGAWGEAPQTVPFSAVKSN